MSFNNNNTMNNMRNDMKNEMRGDMRNDKINTMMNNMMCNIIIQNNSGTRGNYVFCCAPPECNAAEAQTTAWVCADVPQNGSHCVSTNDQVFACKSSSQDKARSLVPSLIFSIGTGTCSESRSDSRQECLRQGSLVRNGCVTPVQMGNDHTLATAYMTTERGMPMFGPSTMDARNSNFEIECDNTIRGHEDMLVGMAKVGAHGMVAPVAVVSLHATGFLMLWSKHSH